MIRILRLLEYQYDNAQDAKMDMEHWGVPANGTSPHGSSKITSCLIIDLDAVESNAEKARRFDEIIEAASRSSLAQQGLEMIEYEINDKSESE